jgi:hypothetical protein
VEERESKSFGIRSFQEKLLWINKKYETEAFCTYEDEISEGEDQIGTSVLLNLALIFKYDPDSPIIH